MSTGTSLPSLSSSSSSQLLCSPFSLSPLSLLYPISSFSRPSPHSPAPPPSAPPSPSLVTQMPKLTSRKQLVHLVRELCLSAPSFLNNVPASYLSGIVIRVDGWMDARRERRRLCLTMFPAQMMHASSGGWSTWLQRRLANLRLTQQTSARSGSDSRDLM